VSRPGRRRSECEYASMEALAGGGIWLGLALGFIAGMAWQGFRQSLKNLRTAKDAIPKLKETASGSRWRAIKWALIVTGYAVVVAVVAVRLAT
jgi:hypothetical protein